MAHTCRGTINLASAFIDTIDSTNFVITNGPSQVFHLRTINEVERQRWVTALELAKAKAIKSQESGGWVWVCVSVCVGMWGVVVGWGWVSMSVCRDVGGGCVWVCV